MGGIQILGKRPRGRELTTAIRYHPGDWVVFNYWSGAGLCELVGRVMTADALTCDICVYQQGKETVLKILVTSILAAVPEATALSILELQGRLM